jgi:hypothetical protein
MRERTGRLLITIVASTSKDAGKVRVAPSTTIMSGIEAANATAVMNVGKMIATIAAAKASGKSISKDFGWGDYFKSGTPISRRIRS